MTDFTYLKEYSTISLTTFYKSGNGVATPVDFIINEDKLYVNTSIKSYKVKRLKNTTRAIIAPCSFRGKILGPEIKVIGRLLPKGEDTEILELFKIKWNKWYFKLFRVFGKLAFWKKPPERIILEFSII